MPFEFPASTVPGEYAINPDAAKGSHDEKFASFSALYPERDRYLTVDVARYQSTSQMHRERASLWNHTWTCAGRVSDVASVGSWFKYDLGNESFIVVRTKKQEIRAFYNVCRHRGNQLIATDFGKSQRFMCSFHGWQWHADGRLAEITDRSTFRPSALCADTDLRAVQCEAWAGFVFINTDPKAAPLTEFLAEIADLMGVYQMENMNLVKDVVIELDANWKIVLEAFLESYHLQVTHPQAKPMLDDVNYQIDIFQNGHGRLQTTIGIPSPRERDRQSLHPALGVFLAEAGLDPKLFEGRAMDVRAAIAGAKRRTNNPFGLDYSAFSDSQLTDDWNYSVFPNMTFNTHPEGVLVMRFLPHATDPEKSYYHVWVLSRKLAEGARPPAYMGVEDNVDISGKTRPVKRYNHKSKAELGEVLEQDIANIEGVQRGLRSRSFDFNKYSEQEQRCMQLHAEIDRYATRFPGSE
jgi:phenylpropionate dioxygenase-like ring-hydroxylating dioxygenase large terminal subunit